VALHHQENTNFSVENCNAAHGFGIGRPPPLTVQSYPQLSCDRMLYIILRGRRFHVIVLNVHNPTEDKIVGLKDSLYEELECVFDKFPKYQLKMLLADFNPKVGKEDIFKPTIGNESLHKISNDSGVSSKFCHI
jgi:hypothetical protein